MVRTIPIYDTRIYLSNFKDQITVYPVQVGRDNYIRYKLSAQIGNFSYVLYSEELKADDYIITIWLQKVDGLFQLTILKEE